MLHSSAVRLLLSGLAMLLVLATTSAQTVNAQTQPPALTGRWELEFTVRSIHHSVLFDAQPSGEGTFLGLDSGSTPQLAPKKALWRLRGQSSAIYFFGISGQVELPTIGGPPELVGLDFQAVSDLTLPINRLSGSVQYHPPREPGDARGGDDPLFDFSGRRLNSIDVQVLSPVSGEKLRRGKEARIEWEVQTALGLATQTVFVSVDGGENFIVIASVDGAARSLVWVVPEESPRTKKALFKVVAMDQLGFTGEGLSAQPLRIK